MGNRQRLLIHAQAGVYRYDQLIVLRDTDMPAVLLEAGSIINREEELRMGSVEHQALLSAAVADAVKSFCTARRPRTPTNAASRAGEVSTPPQRPPPWRPCGQSSNADLSRRQWLSYSITPSARASRDGGTFSPSAFAVLRLVTVSYLVGTCTGRSAGGMMNIE